MSATDDALIAVSVVLPACGRMDLLDRSLDALMRGDFKTRMDALSQGVQNALLTPDEARGLENRPPMEGGDKLYIQGATVPLGSQPVAGSPPPAEQGGADEPRDPDTDPAA